LQNWAELTIRNPKATRPWQHVLEPLSGYLTLGNLLINRKLSRSIKPNWNFGPNPSNCKTVLYVANKIISLWGVNKKINIIKNKKFKESKLLMLGIQKAKKELNWYPRLTLEETIKMTVDWYKLFFSNGKMEKLSRQQIDFFLHK
jgi:CDP-glucose 4,6-dehydratase